MDLSCTNIDDSSLAIDI